MVDLPRGKQLSADERSAANVLLHLVRLSHEVATRPDVWGIAIYAVASDADEPALLDERLAAESGFEGVACVDDVARAAVLALRQYELEGEPLALKLAERWLSFVEYMQLADGRFCNFILGWTGRRNEAGITSIPGGGWWTARALWALGLAYRVTGKQHYRRAFKRGWTTGLPLAADISAIMLLGTLDYLRRSRDRTLEVEARVMANHIAQTTVDGYLVHHPGEASIHMWGYEQVTALVAASNYFHEPAYLEPCISTAELVFRRHALEGPYRDFPGRAQCGLCAYDVSCCCRGLAALHDATGDSRYAEWFFRLIEWFDGRNGNGRPLYHRGEGRCHDGIDGGQLNPNCGAESAIEAGFVELERRRLLRDRQPKRRRPHGRPAA